MAWLDKRVGADGGELRCVAQGLEGAGGDGEGKAERCCGEGGPEVLRLYPEYVGDANAYEFLAAAQLAKGDKQGAMIR